MNNSILRKLDVIVTSICRPHFYTTYRSFKENVTYSGEFHFIIHIDVLKKNRRNLPALLNFLKTIGVADYHINFGENDFANAINYVYRKIKTPFYFHLEDDWIFKRKVDLDFLLNIFARIPYINQIRFSKEKLIPIPESVIKKYKAKNELHLLPGEQVKVNGIDMIVSQMWSFNPHLGRTAILKEFYPVPKGINPEEYMTKRYLARYGSNGLYIFGKYYDEPYVKDIGRKNWILTKFTKLIEICHDPSLIRKSERIKKEYKYRGRPYDINNNRPLEK
ncbi:MAG: hypothetical protein N3A65_03170 [candidate division WOR-3 bacterium]|nr:hypothetical protein [candidate division WOR-3 bacterium]